jgi:hypothetical protein
MAVAVSLATLFRSPYSHYTIRVIEFVRFHSCLLTFFYVGCLLNFRSIFKRQFMIHPYGRFSVQVNTAVARHEGGCVYPQAVRISSSLFPGTPRVDNSDGYWSYSHGSGIITASQLALHRRLLHESTFLPPHMPDSAMPLHGWVEDDATSAAALEAYFEGAKPTFNEGLALSFHGLQLALIERTVAHYAADQAAPRHDAAILFLSCLKNVVALHEARAADDLPSSFVPEVTLLVA